MVSSRSTARRSMSSRSGPYLRASHLLFVMWFSSPAVAQVRPSPSATGETNSGSSSSSNEHDAIASVGPGSESSDVTPVGGVVAPRLQHYEPADAPADLTTATAVTLHLTLDESGKVTNATAEEGSDSELARRAIAAAERFIFTPAARVAEDGTRQPIPVVIEYQYWFQPQPPPAPAPAAADSPRTEPATTTEPPHAEVSPISPEDEELYEATATVQAPPREPTKRRMERQELTRVAGTRGDPLRAIEIMPGVGQSNGDAPIIRGASGYESAIFLDGSPVPFLYHFGGLTSFVHPRLIDHVELYPGNFSARYGRVTGGVVETGLRKPSNEFGFIADANLIDTSLLLEGPITDRLTVAVAGRRSNMDVVFDALVPDGTFSTVAAPVYYDYQGIVHYQTPSGSEFRIAAFGSRDSLRLMFDEPSQLDPSFRGKVEAAIEFHRVQLMHKTRIGDVKQRLQLGVGTQALSQALGTLSTAYFDIYEVDARAEWEWNASEAFTLIGGIDTTGQQLAGAYRGPVATAQEGQVFEGPVDQVVVDKTTIHLFNPAAYVEARVNATSRWQLIPGVRFDYYYQIRDTSINPRLSQRFALTDTTTLKGGVGMYSQPPIYHEALPPIGNRNLEAYHSIHSSLGFEQQLTKGWRVDVEGFHKHLYNRIVNTPNGEPPMFINDGIGRIYGVELGSTFRSEFGLSGQLSYTLSNSERRDRDQAWRRFDQDQPHILNVAGNYDFGSGWELGTRFRYVSGNPSTPIQGGTYDANSDTYRPVLGALNSARDPAFHQLDVRGQKTFRVGEGSIAVYLDVQNVYNSPNPRGFSYSYDYQEREPAASSFIFPNLGIRGQL